MRLSNTGSWDNKKDIKWLDPYMHALPMDEIFKEETIRNLPNLEENYKKMSGCESCNYETYIRDHDGTWLKDCECINK